MPKKKNDESKIARPIEESLNLPELALVPVRDTVFYPHLLSPLIVGRDQSIRAVEAAMANSQRLVVFLQRDPEVQDPKPEDLYTIGTEVSIGRLLRMPDGTTSVIAQGTTRVKLIEIVQTDPFLRARVMPIFEPNERNLPTEALMRAVLALFEKTVRLNQNLPDDAYVAAMNTDTPGWLADLVASSLNMEMSQRQDLLETLDPITRLQKISILLAKEVDVLELQNKIHSQVQEEVDKTQREYYLREQMRVIQHELGENDPQTREITELREKIKAAGMPKEVEEKAEHELERLAQMPGAAPEVGVIRTYVDWLIALPWAKLTTDNLDIAAAATLLDEQHYGLKKAKERILEYMAVRKLAAEKMRSPILCFVGPPGTGKTSMGRSIAQALGRSFVRVSLGGIHDEAEIRGHRRTYIGALPGRIVQTMKRAATINPVFMLDEVDKIGADFRGDPSAALLEVLDPEQNFAFSDHYLDVPYDLSKVMFITTANMLDPIPPALRDRMEVIEFPGYIEEEKVAIAKQFLIPRQKEEHGLVAAPKFSDDAIRSLIREYTYEAGVRNLEREIANICRKVARMIAEDKRAPAHITEQSLFKYLGPTKFTFGIAEEKDEVGVATGVAVSEAGGDTMAVEVTLMRGKGGLMLTGQLGDVMQESAQAALSYSRTHAQKLGLKVNFDKIDIHIHVPEGAIPKDGPSAGITIATALISALSHRAVHKDVAMTGEITLRGRVLPIGGLRDKVLAAHRAGLKTMLVPKKNKKDMIDVPKKVQREMQFIYVERMDQVLPVALTRGRVARRVNGHPAVERQARASLAAK
ncbi:MAG: endopeptidase La [Chloroflexota bacterium]|nr:endopeptidase La [Chloroflexota bacterium]